MGFFKNRVNVRGFGLKKSMDDVDISYSRLSAHLSPMLHEIDVSFNYCYTF